MKELTFDLGSIKLGDEQLPYANYANYMFTIRRPANEVISLNFVTSDGFEMEWHNQVRVSESLVHCFSFEFNFLFDKMFLISYTQF